MIAVKRKKARKKERKKEEREKKKKKKRVKKERMKKETFFVGALLKSSDFYQPKAWPEARLINKPVMLLGWAKEMSSTLPGH